MWKIPKWSGRVVSPVWTASQRKAGSEGRGKWAEREGQHLEMQEGALRERRSEKSGGRGGEIQSTMLEFKIPQARYRGRL